jgi:hypothetical protein
MLAVYSFMFWINNKKVHYYYTYKSFLNVVIIAFSITTTILFIFGLAAVPFSITSGYSNWIQGTFFFWIYIIFFILYIISILFFSVYPILKKKFKIKIVTSAHVASKRKEKKDSSSSTN